MPEGPQPGRQALAVLVMLAGLAIGLWAETPAWQRRMAVARMRAAMRQAVGRLARRTGHQSMAAELDGDEVTAGAGYTLTERLSRLRDRL